MTDRIDGDLKKSDLSFSAHLDNCARLGVAQRTAPNSQEALGMRAEVAAYYPKDKI